MLLQTQTEEAELEDDDPQVSYMISAWARMCKILGKDFTQYLPLVMPPLLKTAAMKPEVAIFDAEDNKTDMNEVDGWEFVTLGDQQVARGVFTERKEKMMMMKRMMMIMIKTTMMMKTRMMKTRI